MPPTPTHRWSKSTGRCSIEGKSVVSCTQMWKQVALCTTAFFSGHLWSNKPQWKPVLVTVASLSCANSPENPKVIKDWTGFESEVKEQAFSAIAFLSCKWINAPKGPKNTLKCKWYANLIKTLAVMLKFRAVLSLLSSTALPSFNQATAAALCASPSQTKKTPKKKQENKNQSCSKGTVPLTANSKGGCWLPVMFFFQNPQRLRDGWKSTGKFFPGAYRFDLWLRQIWTHLLSNDRKRPPQIGRCPAQRTENGSVFNRYLEIWDSYWKTIIFFASMFVFGGVTNLIVSEQKMSENFEGKKPSKEKKKKTTNQQTKMAWTWVQRLCAREVNNNS